MKRLLVVLMALGMSLGTWGEAHAHEAVEGVPAWVRVYNDEDGLHEIVSNKKVAPETHEFAYLVRDNQDQNYSQVIYALPRGRRMNLVIWAEGDVLRQHWTVYRGWGEDVEAQGGDPLPG